MPFHLHEQQSHQLLVHDINQLEHALLPMKQLIVLIEVFFYRHEFLFLPMPQQFVY